jgi:enamine deaminase RidA (YjgF/YER057c/UK114 family)
MAKRDAVFPAGRQALYEINRYSAAIRSGDFLFVSGQVGSREDGSPEPVFEKQVQLAFDNLAAVLKAAGCTFDDVVDVTSFHTDPATQWETFNAVRDQGHRTDSSRSGRLGVHPQLRMRESPERNVT